jgi:hypothetical protein
MTFQWVKALNVERAKALDQERSQAMRNGSKRRG